MFEFNDARESEDCSVPTSRDREMTPSVVDGRWPMLDVIPNKLFYRETGNEEVVAVSDDEPKPSDDGWQWKGVREGPDETFLASVQKQGAEVGLRIARKSGSGNGAVVADGDDEPKPSDDGWQWESVQEGPGKAFLVSGRKRRAEVGLRIARKSGSGNGAVVADGDDEPKPSDDGWQWESVQEGPGKAFLVSGRKRRAEVAGGGRGRRGRGLESSPPSSTTSQSRQKADGSGGGYRRALRWAMDREDTEVGGIGWSSPSSRSSTTTRSYWRASRSRNGWRRDLARPFWGRFKKLGRAGPWIARMSRKGNGTVHGVFTRHAGAVELMVGSERTSESIHTRVDGKEVKMGGQGRAHRGEARLGRAEGANLAMKPKKSLPSCIRTFENLASVLKSTPKPVPEAHRPHSPSAVYGRSREIGGPTGRSAVGGSSLQFLERNARNAIELSNA
ncbi:hypothetical protein FPV67DRAFT_1445609 [Lyophyllum atratum]|nr:hypothetical protein FPV67DRAFT_1445609 [Lyophyllum atratum]